jgi:hypothetical protein
MVTIHMAIRMVKMSHPTSAGGAKTECGNMKLEDVDSIDEVVVKGRVEGLRQSYEVTLSSPTIMEPGVPGRMKCVWDRASPLTWVSGA